MFLETWLTWIANHVGLGSVKAITGARKDIVQTKEAKIQTKKAELEIDKLEQDATKRKSLIISPTEKEFYEHHSVYQKVKEQERREQRRREDAAQFKPWKERARATTGPPQGKGCVVILMLFISIPAFALLLIALR